MAVRYSVVTNALTSPVSYSCRYEANDILGYDEIASAINQSNPTIPAATAKSVLEAFREECVAQLADGYTVKLAGFVSFVPSLPVKLDNPTDPLPSNAIDIKAKPSKPFKDDVSTIATYERAGYPIKAPSIVSLTEVVYDYPGFVRENFNVRIDGENIGGFETETGDLGIFCLNSDGVEVAQTQLGLNNPSSVIFSYRVGTPPTDPNDVELQFYGKNQYTTNGEIRTSNIKLARTYNDVDLGQTNVFVANGVACASVAAYTGGTTNCRLRVRINPIDSALLVSAATMEGDWGDEVEITANTDYVITGLPADFTLTVSDVDDLRAAAVRYQNYLIDYCVMNNH